MIITMAGKIDFVGPNFVILETADTGFKIFANSQTLTGIKTGKRSKLYLHHYLRENCEDLFGFLTFEELSILDAGGDYSEVLEGLKSLGYKAEEAKKILAKTPKNLKTAEEKITW